MMRISLLIFAVFLLAICSRPVQGDELKPLEYKIERLSDRVLTISALTGNYRTVALATKKGLVVIDTMWSPASAAQARKIIEKEFNRRDFIYVINSSSDDSASRGNGIYPEAIIVAHAECKKGLIRDRENLAKDLNIRANEFHERVVRTEKMIKGLDPKSDRAIMLKNWADLCRWIEKDMRQGYDVVLPGITFTDKMDLDLGDLNLQLVYWGKAGSDGDILVRVPEEGLLFLGDLFLAWHVMPYHYNIRREMDVDNWLKVLDEQLSQSAKLKHIIRANGSAYSKKRLIQGRDLIRGIRNDVLQADKERQTLDNVLLQFKTPEKKYPFIKNWPMPSLIHYDIKTLITRLWRKNHTSAVEEIAKMIETKGLDQGKIKFSELKKITNNKYYFTEQEFNTQGYRYLSAQKNRQAIAMFSMATEIYPQSANAWDSLADSHMKNGNKKLAVKYFRKSLTLNPKNDNARAMLKKLESGK